MKRVLRVLSVLSLFILISPLFPATKPSMDGRAVVAEEGVFPPGMFAKSAGYLPGDSVSVRNPSTGVVVDVLILGTIDSQEGIAILLSPEAAEKLFIARNSNSLVSITKRGGAFDNIAKMPGENYLDPDKEPESALPPELRNKIAQQQQASDQMAQQNLLNSYPDESISYGWLKEPNTANDTNSFDEPYINNYGESDIMFPSLFPEEPVAVADPAPRPSQTTAPVQKQEPPMQIPEPIPPAVYPTARPTEPVATTPVPVRQPVEPPQVVMPPEAPPAIALTPPDDAIPPVDPFATALVPNIADSRLEPETRMTDDGSRMTSGPNVKVTYERPSSETDSRIGKTEPDAPSNSNEVKSDPRVGPFVRDTSETRITDTYPLEPASQTAIGSQIVQKGEAETRISGLLSGGVADVKMSDHFAQNGSDDPMYDEQSPANNAPNTKVGELPNGTAPNTKVGELPNGTAPNTKIGELPNGAVPDTRINDLPYPVSPNTKIGDMPAGAAPGTRVGELPNGTAPNTKIGELPNGTAPNTKIGELPNGTAPNTKIGELPNGTAPNTKIGELPNGTAPNTKIGELPNGAVASTRLDDLPSSTSVDDKIVLPPAGVGGLDLVQASPLPPEQSGNDSPKLAPRSNNGQGLTMVPAPGVQSTTEQPPRFSPPKAQNSDISDRVVANMASLKRGSYYVQIATLSNEENIRHTIEAYDANYPVVLVPNAAKAYQVLIGPLTVDEYGVVLARFQTRGYKDAFLRKIK